MKVIFRRNPDGSVFTLFPEFASRTDAHWCLARTADWKPAEAELARAIAETEPAAPAEYQPLLAKVRSMGVAAGATVVESDSPELERLRGTSTMRYLLKV
jgi:hypothetical protein